MPTPNYTLGPVGKDFSSLADAEAQMQADWTGAQPFTLDCDAFVDTNVPVDFSGWSPNPTQANNVTIRAAPGAEHNGLFGSGYVLENGVGGTALTSDLRWMVFQDIEIRCTTTGSAFNSSGDDSRMERLLVHIFNTSSSSNGLVTTGPRSKVYNCISWLSQANNNIGTRRGFDSTGGATDFYNCTAAGLWRSSGFNAISAASGRKYRNCLSICSGNDFDSAVVGSDFEFNGSEDGTAAGQPGSWTGLATTDFTDYDAGIFSIVPGGQADSANNPGVTDPSGGAYLDDITRTLRPATWTMGAFDLVSAPGPITWRSVLTDISVAIGDPAQKDFSPYFTGDQTPFDYSIDWWEDQAKLTPTVIPPGFTFDTNTGILESANALGPEFDFWYVVTGTDQGSNTATSLPDPVRLRIYEPSSFIGPDIPDSIEEINTPINITTAERFDGGQGGYRYALLQYDPPDPSWTIAIDINTGVISGTGPVSGFDDYVFVRREDLGTAVSGSDNYFHILFQMFPDLYYQMSDEELAPYTPPNDPIPPGTLINDWGSVGTAGDGVSGVARAQTGYGSVWIQTYRPEAADGDPATPNSGVVIPQAHDRGELFDPANSWTITWWSDTTDAVGISQTLFGNANLGGSGADGGGFKLDWDANNFRFDLTLYDQSGGSTTFNSGSESPGANMYALVYDHTVEQIQFYAVGTVDSVWDTSAANWDGPGANKVLSIGATHDRGNDTVASLSNIWQWASFPRALSFDEINQLLEAGFVAGFASAYSNGFRIEFTDPVPTGPTITQQPTPATQTVTEPDPASSTAAANSSGGGLSVQWYEGNPGDISTPVPGATTDTLSFDPSSVADSGTYFARYTDGNGFTDTETYVLTVNAAPTGPTITQQPTPASQTVTEPNAASTTAAANSSGGGLSVQWYKGLPGDISTPVPGAVLNTLTIDPTAVADTGTYFARYTDGNGFTDTNTYDLTVNAAVVAPIVEAGGPYSGTVNTPILLNTASVTLGSDQTAVPVWSIGAGSPGGGVFSNVNEVNPSFTPDTEGLYNLDLEVDPNDGPPVTDSASLDSQAPGLIDEGIYAGGNAVNFIRVGNTDIKEVYAGDIKVWPVWNLISNGLRHRAKIPLSGVTFPDEGSEGGTWTSQSGRIAGPNPPFGFPSELGFAVQEGAANDDDWLRRPIPGWIAPQQDATICFWSRVQPGRPANNGSIWLGWNFGALHAGYNVEPYALGLADEFMARTGDGTGATVADRTSRAFTGHPDTRDGQWHFFAYKFAGPNCNVMFIDENKYSWTSEGGSSTSVGFNGGGSLWICNVQEWNTTDAVDWGDLADLRMYDRILDDEEVIRIARGWG